MAQLSALEFLSQQTPAVKATVLHDAMRNQDLASLGLLAELKLFFAAPGEEHELDGLTRFSPFESPVLGAVGSVCAGASYASVNEDPVTGEVYEGPEHSQLTLRSPVKPEFLSFVRGLLEQYLEEVQSAAAFFAPALGKSLQREIRATSGAFLAACAVTDDVDLARKALAAGAESDWGTSNYDAWLSKRVVKPAHVNVERMVHPVAVAFETSNEKLLDAFIDFGWRPTLPMESHSVIPDLSKVLARSFFRAEFGKPLNMFELVQTDELTLTPGMLGKVLPLMRKPDGTFAEDPALKDLRKWADALLEDDELQLDLVRTLMEHGVYEIAPEESFTNAARRGILELVDHLEDKVDWSSFGDENRPLDAVFASSFWEEHPDDMKQFAMHMMEMCIANGQAKMVSQPAFLAVHNNFVVQMPIIECAKRGMTDGFVLCLEQGADPEFENECDESALSVAAAQGEDSYPNIVRSVQARRAAASALNDLDITLASSPGMRP